MVRNVVNTTKTIWIDREAYFFLKRLSREQRGCQPLTQEVEDRLWNRVRKTGELYQCDDNSFGGGDGTYHGRWWSWSVDTIKSLLDEAGLSYTEGEDVEYISVYI